MYESMLKGLGNASIGFSDIPVREYFENEVEKPTAGNSIEEAEKAYLSKDYESARAIYDQVLKEGPFNQSALLGRANTLLMMNKFELALKDYNTIITLSAQKINDGESNETINDAIVYRGVTQYFLGNYEPAMNDLDRILEKGISNADAYLFRGLCKKQLGVDDNGCNDFSRHTKLKTRLLNRYTP
jgi:tetratricopeptide (TPR) repeat protein